MDPVLLHADLYSRLQRIRDDVRRIFDETRLRDRGTDDIDGKRRLERVPAFSHRNFRRLRGRDIKLVRAQLLRLADFINGASDLKPIARSGLKPIDLDRRLSRLRGSAHWQETGRLIRLALEDEPRLALGAASVATIVREEPVRVASLASLARSGNEVEEVIRGVNKVYARLAALPALEGNDVGPTDKWDDLMRSHSSCVHVLTHRGAVGGYWMGFALSAAAYASALNGENVNSSLSEFDVEPMELPGAYQFYLVDLFVLPEFREAGSAAKLLRSFTTYLSGCAENKLVVERVVANVSSRSAEVTARKLGFRYVTEHKTHLSPKLEPGGALLPTRIYELDLLAAVRPEIFRFDAELARSYPQPAA
jgi:GNAT superfamily N-acetyltransferase